MKLLTVGERNGRKRRWTTLVRSVLLLSGVLTLAGCRPSAPQGLTDDVLLPFTPVKSQGQSEVCWAYAMLSTIETEHICRGDSVHLSVAFVEKAIEQEPAAPASKRGMGVTTVNLIQKYGLVPYMAMPTSDVPLPRQAFMLGCDYTLQEFAHSVCAPGEYVSLTTTTAVAYGEETELPLPDNWENNRFRNVEPDSLLTLTERAVRGRHGVCWEGDISEPGFDWQEGYAAESWWEGTTTDDHCMAIVGLAHDAQGVKYFIMKNSWGTKNPYGGLMYLSYGYFLKKTVAVYMSRDAITCSVSR